MGDMRIESFVTPEAVPELREALAVMKDLAKEILDLNKAMKSGETGLGQAKSIGQIAAMQQTLAQQNQQLTESFKKLTEAVANYQKKASTSVKTPAQTLAAQVKKDKAEAEKAQKEADKKYEADFKKLLAEEKKQKDKASKDNLDRIKAEQKANSDKAKFEKQLNTAQAREIRQVNAAQAAADKQKAADRKAAEAQALRDAKIAEDLANDYKQLGIAYNEAALKAKNLQIQMGADHPIAVQATKDAAALGQQLKDLDASVGQYGRNVGNYSNATKNLRGSLTQIARELPSIGNGFQTFASAIGNNIAPAQEAFARFREEQAAFRAEGKPTISTWKAIGSAILSWQMLLIVGVTLLTTYSKEIGEFTSVLFKGAKAVDIMKDKQEVLNKTFEGSEIKKAVADFEELEQQINLARKGLLNKDQVLRIYNETLGKTIGSAADLDEAETLMVTHKAAYLEMMRQKTIAQALYAAASDKVVAAELLRMKAAEGDLSLSAKVIGIRKALGKAVGVFGVNPLGIVTNAVRGAQEAAEAEAKGLESSGSALTKFADVYAKAYADLGTRAGMNPLGDEGIDKTKPKKAKEPEDKFNERLKMQEEVIRNQAALQQEAAENEMLRQKEIADDETRRWEERLTAYKAFAIAKTTAAEIAAQTEIDVVRDQLAEIARIEKLAPGARTGEEQDLLDRKFAVQKELERMTVEGQNNILKATQEGNREILEETKDHDKDVVDSMKHRVDTVQALMSQWIKNLKSDLDEEDKALKAAQERRDNYISTGISLAEIVQSVTEATANARVAAIDKEIAKLQERTDMEVKNIELSTASETERVRLIAEARKEAELKQSTLEKERAIRAKKQAEFNKALAISFTIITTAAAVMDAWLKGITPVDKAAAAVAVGAAGLAQIAKIASTPIPSYHDGTEGVPHEGGPALMFEGNKAEMVFEKGKKPWIGDKEGIYQLSRGAEVVSNADLMAAVNAYALGTGAGIKTKTEAQGSGSVVGMDKVVKAIEDKPVGSFEVSGRGIRHFVEAGNAHLEFERNLLR